MRLCATCQNKKVGRGTWAYCHDCMASYRKWYRESNKESVYRNMMEKQKSLSYYYKKKGVKRPEGSIKMSLYQWMDAFPQLTLKQSKNILTKIMEEA